MWDGRFPGNLLVQSTYLHQTHQDQSDKGSGRQLAMQNRYYEKGWQFLVLQGQSNPTHCRILGSILGGKL